MPGGAYSSNRTNIESSTAVSYIEKSTPAIVFEHSGQLVNLLDLLRHHEEHNSSSATRVVVTIMIMMILVINPLVH